MPAHTAAEIMQEFAERTGVTGLLPQQRYLWTDAFAVCNLISQAGQDPQALPAARALIEAAGSPKPRRLRIRPAAACASASRWPSAVPAKATTRGSNGSATGSTSTTSPAGCTPWIR